MNVNFKVVFLSNVCLHAGLYVLPYGFETAESIIEGGDGSESEHQVQTAV